MDHLRGLRIISFNHFYMGPAGIQFLADLGADVITVEPIGGAFQRHWGGVNNKTVDGQTMLLLAANRNKRSVALDLRAPDGLEVARRLIAGADVVAENYRPGVMDKLGLGYEVARGLRPDIIYAAASGFGADGPYVKRPGQDLLIQALSGLAHITGTQAGGPRAVGVSAVDHHGAALFAAGILAALLRRARTGVGGRVDVNLLSAALDLQNESLVCALNGAPPDSTQPPDPIAGWYFPAPYGLYATADGHLAISLGNLDTLNEVLGVPLPERVSEVEAYARRDAAAAAVARAVAQRSTAEWLPILGAADIWHAPVNDYAAVAADPQVRHNGSLVTMDGATGQPVTLVAHPVRYDGAVPEIRLPPQKLGAQTREVLCELGYTENEIVALLEKRIAEACVA